MGEAAWKTTQRRWCRRFGQDSSWRGEPGSDARAATRTLSVEVTRTARGTPSGRKIEQARKQGRDEGLPWVLVVCGHHAEAQPPVAVVDAAWLADLIANHVDRRLGP